jgi:DNA-binding transcriptional ArsR family regulator
MADHSASSDASSPDDAHIPVPPAQAHTADYPLDDELVLTEPAQYRAMFHDLRGQLVALLSERAATTQELAHAVGRPKGTVGHHLKVLEAAGLVRIVRTKRVRALEAKYYGRTARVFLYSHVHEAADRPVRILRDAAAEIPPPGADAVVDANVRHVRISHERAAEWATRLNALLDEFAVQPRSGQTVYGFTFALYPTDRAPLPDETDPAGSPDDAGPPDDAGQPITAEPPDADRSGGTP